MVQGIGFRGFRGLDVNEQSKTHSNYLNKIIKEMQELQKANYRKCHQPLRELETYKTSTLSTPVFVCAFVCICVCVRVHVHVYVCEHLFHLLDVLSENLFPPLSSEFLVLLTMIFTLIWTNRELNLVSILYSQYHIIIVSGFGGSHFLDKYLIYMT